MLRTLLFFSASFAMALGQCAPDVGWYGDETLGVCYSLGKLTGAESPPLEDFFEAGAYCEVFEGGVRMATIRTQAQQDFIRSNLIGTNVQYVWTSGNDLSHEGSFEWGYNTADLVVYNAWIEGEPNGGSFENCILLRNLQVDQDAGRSFGWVDFPCEAAEIEYVYDDVLPIYPLCEYTP